jgi:transposase
VLLIDDDTIRTWHRLFEEDGVDGLAGFNYRGRACQLTLEQQEKLKTGETLPRTTCEVGAWIEQAFGIVYESRSGLIALLHRLRCEYRKLGEMAKLLRRQWSPEQIAGRRKRMEGGEAVSSGLPVSRQTT